MGGPPAFQLSWLVKPASAPRLQRTRKVAGSVSTSMKGAARGVQDVRLNTSAPTQIPQAGFALATTTWRTIGANFDTNRDSSPGAPRGGLQGVGHIGGPPPRPLRWLWTLR